ncbi:MAG: flagellar basal body rod C-terminal domain-containing protein [Huintestinicola sp.]
MASSFFGLYVQRDAMQLAQKGLDITGHNITNIETKGYSRQRLDVCSVANAGGNLGYNTSVSLAGRGSDAIGVTQIRDKLLDTKVRTYSSQLCDIGAKTTILSDIEDVVDDVENEKTGLAAILGNLKAAFQSFSSTGSDRIDLANICVSSADSVVNVLKNFSSRIDDISASTEADIENTNKRINSILKEMASLNKQIEDSYVQMEYVNATEHGYTVDNQYGPLELKDSFNNLCDELSQYINISVNEEPTGSFTVSFGDKTLVYKDSYAKTDIKFVADAKDEVTSPSGTKINAAFVSDDTFYDEDGNEITGTPAAGTELFDKYGESTGLKADGSGGYVDSEGNAVDKLYVLGKNKFYATDPTSDPNAKEVTDMGTINDGNTVYDESGNKIVVKGSFDAECIDMTFTELYVSSTNTAKEWSKTNREEVSDTELNLMIRHLNELINSTNDVEEAYRYEEEVMDAFAAKGVDYRPIFKEHITNPAEIPSYAISISEGTDTLTGGSIKGLFDMYNGEGCYAGAEGNPYKGVKYYSETMRTLAKAVVAGFNSIYDEINKANASDPDYVPFKMFEFDGTEEVENLKVADVWKNDPLRAVHPQGTDEDDYNYDELDNAWLNKILAQFENKHSFSSEPEEYTYEEFVAYYGNTVGSQLEYELGNYDSTNTMYESVSGAREEVMGVSMDEEGVNMMNYQKWYNAIARMITSLDQCLDKLINGTGVCGL